MRRSMQEEWNMLALRGVSHCRMILHPLPSGIQLSHMRRFQRCLILNILR